MLFRWLLNLWRELWMLVIPPPPGYKPKKVDLKAKCPSCGHGPMSVQTVILSASPNRPSAMRKAQLLWTCSVCKGWVYTDPIGGTDADKIHGAEVQGI